MKGTLNGNLILYPTTCCFGAFGGLVMIFNISDVRWQSQVLWWAEDRGEGSVLRKAGWGWDKTEPCFLQDWVALLPCYCFLSIYSFPPNPGMTTIGQFTVKYSHMLTRSDSLGYRDWKGFLYSALLIPSWEDFAWKGAQTLYFSLCKNIYVQEAGIICPVYLGDKSEGHWFVFSFPDVKYI